MLQPPTPVCSIVTQYPISETTMNFSNLRVGPRLGLGFGVILLITAIIALGGMWRIGVRGLCGACRENFYAWDFDAVFKSADECKLTGEAPQ